MTGEKVKLPYGLSWLDIVESHPDEQGQLPGSAPYAAHVS